jgi:hypothetical protein
MESIERDVLDRLDRAGIDYYITGSEALSVWGEPRQTIDIDIVLDIPPHRYEADVRPAFEDAYLVNDLIQVGGRGYGSVLHKTELRKADLITRRDDAFGRVCFERRQSMDDPILGPAWFIGPEDLILAQLEWSDGGASERQVGDASSIIRTRPDLDWDHLERYADLLGIRSLMGRSVVIDRGQQALDARLRSASLEQRRVLHARLRAHGIARVWAQVDRAEPMTELETARFVLRRLYPDLDGPRLESIMDRLAAEFAAGTWSGLQRPIARPVASSAVTSAS